MMNKSKIPRKGIISKLKIFDGNNSDKYLNSESSRKEKNYEEKLEEEKKRFLKEQYNLISVNHKKQIDELYAKFTDNQRKEIENEKRLKEQEKKRIIEEERKKLEKAENLYRKKKLVLGKLKAVLLTIQLFKKAGRDYKKDMKMKRFAFDFNNENMYVESVLVFLPLFNTSFSEILKNYFSSNNLKRFLITNNKFVLNEFGFEKINNESLLENSKFVVEVIDVFLKSSLNLFSKNKNIVSEITKFMKQTFKLKTFILRNFFTKDVLEKLTMNNYGQLKDNKKAILKVYLLFLFLVKIFSFEIFEKINIILNKENDNKIKFAIKIILSVLINSYSKISDNIIKGNENNQTHLTNELKINFIEPRVLFGDIKNNLNENNKHIYSNLLVESDMPQLFNTDLESKLNNIITIYVEDLYKLFSLTYYSD